MEKMNIKPFLSGDRVYYVGNDNALPKNTILIIDDCYKSQCKCVGWDVAIKGVLAETYSGVKPTLGMLTKCESCGVSYISNTILMEKNAKNFRPAQELNAPLMTFTKVAEVEKEQVLILN